LHDFGIASQTRLELIMNSVKNVQKSRPTQLRQLQAKCVHQRFRHDALGRYGRRHLINPVVDGAFPMGSRAQGVRLADYFCSIRHFVLASA
jgi:hypothetical protein